MSKLKILKLNTERNKLLSNSFWFFGLIANIVFIIKKLKKLKKERASLDKLVAQNPDKKVTLESKFKENKSKINQSYRVLIKCLGDCIVASGGNGLAQKVGVNWNDGHLGFGGLLAGCLQCYELYPAKN